LLERDLEIDHVLERQLFVVDEDRDLGGVRVRAGQRAGLGHVSLGMRSWNPGCSVRGSTIAFAVAIWRQCRPSPSVASAIDASVSPRRTTYVFSTSGEFFGNDFA